MARASNNYNPDTYGNTFEKLPEGVHQMSVVSMQSSYDKYGNEQWEMVAQPVDPTYQNEYGFKAWLPADGVVEALFDAGGVDPRGVKPNKDYYPSEFIGSVISVWIYHKPARDNPDKTYANIKRLYPAFSKGGATRGGQQQGQQRTQNTQQNSQQNYGQQQGGYQGGGNAGYGNGGDVDDIPF